MLWSVCVIVFVCSCFLSAVDNSPVHRNRRQVVQHDNLPYGGWLGASNNPSGGSPGAYYGSGNNPNYGGFRPDQNAPSHGIQSVNYGSNSNQQQRPYYSNMNNNYNRPYNRYSPGSQGWYATGGNYWYNHGQSLIINSSLLLIGVIISISCA